MDLLSTSKNTSAVFRVGLLGNFINNDSGPGIARFAIEHINNDPSLLPNVNLQLFFCQLDGSKTQALRGASSLIVDYGVRTLLGGRATDESEQINLLASIYEVPQIGSIPISPSLSDKKTYPYFMRTNPPAQYQNSALLDLIENEKWRQAFVIYSNDMYGIGGLNDLQMQAEGKDILFYTAQITNGNRNFSSLIQTMKRTIEDTRVRIFVIYTQMAEAVPMLKQICDAGLKENGTNNLFVLVNGVGQGFFSKQFDISDHPHLVGSILLVSRGQVDGPMHDVLLADWLKANSTHFPGVKADPMQTWYVYDSALTIAHALDKLMKTKPLDNITGSELMKEMRQINFTGVTGEVTFDSKGDRKGDYCWYNFKPTYDETFGKIAAIYSPIHKNTSFYYALTYNGNTKQPDGVCYCQQGTCDINDVCHCFSGWSGPTCAIFISKSGGWGAMQYSLVTIIPAVFIFFFVAGTIQFVRRKRRALIKDLTEKQRALIKRSDIELQHRIGRGASGEVFKGIFRGTEVAVKKVSTTASSATTEQFEMECAIMTALRHPNIVMFMGMCLDPDNRELLLVMELMEKGSLHDIIHNPKVPLSKALSLHIAFQAAKGMNFLHRSDPPIIHCDLKSHNILMDDKWNSRISDFGITRFKKINDNKKERLPGYKGGGMSSIGTIYWTAPEVFSGNPHTEPSDCYSFGVVLWELFHRDTPYGGKEPMIVANEVQHGARPQMRADIDPEIRKLITECWAQEPSARPSFEVIMLRLREIQADVPHETHSQVINEAPTGNVYLVATEVVKANELWDEVPMGMCEAMQLHNKYIRLKLENNEGYEAECTKNGFLLAFKTIKSAINFCISTQMGLLHLEWPTSLLNHCSTQFEDDGDNLCSSGLHVRMVVHAGEVTTKSDHFGRLKYVGQVVDRINKLQETAAGSVMISQLVMERCQGVTFSEEISVVEIATVRAETPGQGAHKKYEQVYDLLPKSLIGRRNLHTSVGAPIPNAVVLDIEEELSTPSSPKSPPSWDVNFWELSEKDRIGKGAIGDYIKTNWKGREVLQKVLLNQQLAEDDVFVLKAHGSVMAKLQHKNLVTCYGVCLEPDHISLLVEYLPKSVGLNAILADSSISLPFSAKVSLARQIAEGMEYLSSIQQHGSWLYTHVNLKSGNVLVDRDSLHVKVTDFGQGSLKDLARTMTSVGTVAWTAPEILNGEETLTPKVSQYSFGIIMWEIYARSMPYADEHPIRVVTKIVAGHRPQIAMDCPEKYKELMTQCWSNDPKLRPSWTEILAILSSL